MFVCFFECSHRTLSGDLRMSGVPGPQREKEREKERSPSSVLGDASVRRVWHWSCDLVLKPIRNKRTRETFFALMIERTFLL